MRLLDACRVGLVAVHGLGLSYPGHSRPHCPKQETMREETMVPSPNDLASQEQVHAPPPASSTDVTAREWQRLLYGEEEQGYEAPFVTFSWSRWLELQATLMQAVTRFQRAIAHKEACLAGLIVAEMQQVIVELQQEACAWSEPLRRGPGE